MGENNVEQGSTITKPEDKPTSTASRKSDLYTKDKKYSNRIRGTGNEVSERSEIEERGGPMMCTWEIVYSILVWV